MTPSLTVWTCVSYSGILCFDISRETMNGERYKRILIDKVLPHFNRHGELLFQQDEAPCHYTLDVRRILDENLAGRWIGGRASIEWPARSPDLTPCDYFLWSYLHSRVYHPAGCIFNNFQTLEERIEQ